MIEPLGRSGCVPGNAPDRSCVIPSVKRVLLLSVTALLLSACGTATGPAGAEDESLEGRTFLSTAVTEDGAARELVPDTHIRISFDDGRLSASAGCNTMFGGYHLEDGELVVDGLGMTEMGCSSELMEQDSWLSELLTSRPGAALEGDQLVLTSGTTTLRLLDRVVADPDRPLIDTVWLVDSLISGDAVSTTPGDAQATITFAQDGSVAVMPGCNSGRGSYQQSGDTVTIGPLALTRKFCAGAAGELEQAVLEVLQSPELTVEITAGRLTLMGAERGLGLRAQD